MSEAEKFIESLKEQYTFVKKVKLNEGNTFEFKEMNMAYEVLPRQVIDSLNSLEKYYHGIMPSEFFNVKPLIKVEDRFYKVSIYENPIAYTLINKENNFKIVNVFIGFEKDKSSVYLVNNYAHFEPIDTFFIDFEKDI